MEHLWKAIAGVAAAWAIIATTLRVAANRELETSRQLKDEIWPAVKDNSVKIQAVQVTSAECRATTTAKLETLIASVNRIEKKLFNGGQAGR